MRVTHDTALARQKFLALNGIITPQYQARINKTKVNSDYYDMISNAVPGSLRRKP